MGHLSGSAIATVAASSRGGCILRMADLGARCRGCRLCARGVYGRERPIATVARRAKRCVAAFVKLPFDT